MTEQLFPGGRFPGIPGPGMGISPAQDKMARALMTAITESVKGNCECTVCKLMRKVQEYMTQDVLGEG